MRKYAVKFTPEAARIISHFPPEVKKLIRASIDDLVTEPFKGDELQMELAGFRSLKPKRYRIIYKVNGIDSTIEVYYVGPRRNVYQNFKKLLSDIRSKTPPKIVK